MAIGTMAIGGLGSMLGRINSLCVLLLDWIELGTSGNLPLPIESLSTEAQCPAQTALKGVLELYPSLIKPPAPAAVHVRYIASLPARLSQCLQPEGAPLPPGAGSSSPPPLRLTPGLITWGLKVLAGAPGFLCITTHGISCYTYF